MWSRSTLETIYLLSSNSHRRMVIKSTKLSTKFQCQLSSDAIFACIFCPFSTQLHFTLLTPPFSLILSSLYSSFYAFHAHKTDDKNTIRLIRPATKQLVYWATDIPKQSCIGSSSPGSCAGTSSTTTKRSHHSKFRTSRTRSMSRSASTA